MASKENIRGAAAGLFFAGVILAGINYLQPTSSDSEQNSETRVNANDITTEEASSFLEEKGFSTIPTEEYELLTEQRDDLTEEINSLTSQLEELEQSQVNEEENNPEETSTEASDSEVIYNSVLSISSGMTTQEISEQLVSLNIIDDAEEFSNAIFDRQLEQRLQIGEFTLDSQMSINEIVEKITSS
ncbi:hypothetical protein [Salipaludibacillus sp. CF4.18]|uniref:hypothetical protein n=1 Tax=Salipaludibacillus sp. CF4.18 TaxID=3373081 RepID=UPI003EE51C06